MKPKGASDAAATAYQEPLLGKVGDVAKEMRSGNQVLRTISYHKGTMTLQLGSLINCSMGGRAAHATAVAAPMAPSSDPAQATPSLQNHAQPNVGSGSSETIDKYSTETLE